VDSESEGERAGQLAPYLVLIGRGIEPSTDDDSESSKHWHSSSCGGLSAHGDGFSSFGTPTTDARDINTRNFDRIMHSVESSVNTADDQRKVRARIGAPLRFTAAGLGWGPVRMVAMIEDDRRSEPAGEVPVVSARVDFRPMLSVPCLLPANIR